MPSPAPPTDGTKVPGHSGSGFEGDVGGVLGPWEGPQAFHLATLE